MRKSLPVFELAAKTASKLEANKPRGVDKPRGENLGKYQKVPWELHTVMWYCTSGTASLARVAVGIVYLDFHVVSQR